MNKTFFISDTHFNHNKPFVYAARGFKTIEDMNEAIIANWNRVVEDGDKVFVLGDFALGTDLDGIDKILHRLSGEIHLIRANHDTDTRWEFYKNSDANVYVHDWVYTEKMNKHLVYMCHFPTFINNPSYKLLKSAIISLFGHTHSKEKFFSVYDDFGCNPFMYNVACDAHNCTPVSWEEIWNDIQKKYNEFLKWRDE